MFLNGEIYVKKLEFERVDEILGFLHINKKNYSVLHSF